MLADLLGIVAALACGKHGCGLARRLWAKGPRPWKPLL